MAKLKVKDGLSILEAIDILSSISEIDPNLPPRNVKEETLHPHLWLDSQRVLENQELIIQAFASVYRYFQEIQEQGSEPFKDEHILKGLHSIVLILDEAVEKIEKFSDLFKENPSLDSLIELEEFRKLQEYITAQILPHFADKESLWDAHLGVEEEDLVGVVKKGILNIEDIKQDHRYELFYLKKEDRKPFYDYEMIRRLKLLYDFDQIIELREEENSFIRIRQLQDKDFYQKADSILQGSSNLIANFYKDAMKMKGVPLVSAVNKAVMALMLAANPRNWHSVTLTEESHLYKSSAEYFGDFHHYLRQALQSSEYKKMAIVRAEGGPPLFQVCFSLIHKLCAAYFLTISLQKETVAFIRRMIHMGSAMVPSPSAKEESSVWKELLWEDDSIRHVLQKQPNGPVRRIVEAFLRGEIGQGWDPLSHKNIPIHIFSIIGQSKEIAFLRMPAPLTQKSVQGAEMALEFEQFLKGFVLGDKHQKFLLVNLQDRTSWEEHARSEALEDFSVKEDVVRVFSLVGLPKQTDFYFQKEVYQNLDEADLFLQQVLEQFEGREQCGFYWPKAQDEASNLFAKQIVKVIHSVFFGKKAKLSLPERKSFIEIFYFFLVLKAIDLFQPDYMALSCKDSIDTGAASSAGFFSCLRMLISNTPWKEEEKDLLLWILYAPALFFRERAIQKKDLFRLVDAMLVFQEGVLQNRKQLQEECKKLFKEGLWESIELKKAG
jgi:hypothetical protein